MALSLADIGIDVILTYHSNRAEAEQVVSDIEAKGRWATALQLDTGKVGTFAAFYDRVEQYLQAETGQGKFDYLVNNAGVALYQPIAETTEESFDNIINIHYKGVVFLTKQALPLLNDGGGIVNISSGLARFALPGSAVYGSAKGAIEVFTRYLAKELGNRKIRANTVAPGAIATDFGGGRVRDNAQMNQHVSNMTALGRVGQAEDIGSIVAFLCSEGGRWINGQRIEASGGMML